MKKFSRIIALFTFLMLSVAGCQTQSPATGANTTSGSTQAVTQPATTPSTTAAQAAAETVYPYTFKTADGKDVIIDKEPQRIVSLSPTYTEVVYALGKGAQLVGRTDYCDYPAQTKDVVSVGSMTKPSVEKIVELNPDLILVSFMEQEVVDQIEKSGAKVVQILTGNTIDGSYKNMEEIGCLLNANAQAKTLTETIQTDIAAVAAKVKDAAPVSIYYVAGFGKNGDYTAGGDTFLHELITLAGGDNIAKDVQGWNFTTEKLAEKDPQYIVIGSMAKLTEEFKTTEPYKNLTAVKENRVMEVDDNLVNREGPRLAQGVEAIARILHPELFK